LLLIALAGRVAFSWLTARQIWLLDSQALVIPLFLSLAVFAALFVSREFSAPTAVVSGLVAWGLAFSLIPRSLWWQAPALRTELPFGCCAPAWLYCWSRSARGPCLRGAGWRSFGATASSGSRSGRGAGRTSRLLAVRVLRSLGYWN
jgi:hypothetical protein